MIEKQFARIRGRVLPLWFTGPQIAPVLMGLYWRDRRVLRRVFP